MLESPFIRRYLIVLCAAALASDVGLGSNVFNALMLPLFLVPFVAVAALALLFVLPGRRL